MESEEENNKQDLSLNDDEDSGDSDKLQQQNQQQKNSNNNTQIMDKKQSESEKILNNKKQQQQQIQKDKQSFFQNINYNINNQNNETLNFSRINNTVQNMTLVQQQQCNLNQNYDDFLKNVRKCMCKQCDLILQNPVQQCKNCIDSIICEKCHLINFEQKIPCPTCQNETEKRERIKDNEVLAIIKYVQNKARQIKSAVFIKHTQNIIWDQFKKVKISNFRSIKDSNYSREYILYKIDVDDFFVERRYTDFVLLHTHLTKEYKGHIFPMLPPKHSISNQMQQMVGDYGYTHQFLKERRENLEVYLQLLYENPNFKNDTVLEKFISNSRFEYIEDNYYQEQMHVMLGAVQNLNNTLSFGMAYFQAKFQNPVLRYSDITPRNIKNINQLSGNIYALYKILQNQHEKLENMQLAIQKLGALDDNNLSQIKKHHGYMNRQFYICREMRILNSMLLKRTDFIWKRIEGLQFATDTIINHYDHIQARIAIREKKRKQNLYQEEQELIDEIQLLTKELKNMNERLEKDSTELLSVIRNELHQIVKQFKLLKIWEQFIQVRPDNFVSSGKIIKDFEEREKNYFLSEATYDGFEIIDEFEPKQFSEENLNNLLLDDEDNFFDDNNSNINNKKQEEILETKEEQKENYQQQKEDNYLNISKNPYFNEKIQNLFQGDDQVTPQPLDHYGPKNYNSNSDLQNKQESHISNIDFDLSKQKKFSSSIQQSQEQEDLELKKSEKQSESSEDQQQQNIEKIEKKQSSSSSNDEEDEEDDNDEDLQKNNNNNSKQAEKQQQLQQNVESNTNNDSSKQKQKEMEDNQLDLDNLLENIQNQQQQNNNQNISSITNKVTGTTFFDSELLKNSARNSAEKAQENDNLKNNILSEEEEEEKQKEDMQLKKEKDEKQVQKQEIQQMFESMDFQNNNKNSPKIEHLNQSSDLLETKQQQQPKFKQTYSFLSSSNSNNNIEFQGSEDNHNMNLNLKKKLSEIQDQNQLKHSKSIENNNLKESNNSFLKNMAYPAIPNLVQNSNQYQMGPSPMKSVQKGISGLFEDIGIESDSSVSLNDSTILKKLQKQQSINNSTNVGLTSLFGAKNAGIIDESAEFKSESSQIKQQQQSLVQIQQKQSEESDKLQDKNEEKQDEEQVSELFQKSEQNEAQNSNSNSQQQLSTMRLQNLFSQLENKNEEKIEKKQSSYSSSSELQSEEGDNAPIEQDLQKIEKNNQIENSLYSSQYGTGNLFNTSLQKSQKSEFNKSLQDKNDDDSLVRNNIEIIMPQEEEEEEKEQKIEKQTSKNQEIIVQNEEKPEDKNLIQTEQNPSNMLNSQISKKSETSSQYKDCCSQNELHLDDLSHKFQQQNDHHLNQVQTTEEDMDMHSFRSHKTQKSERSNISNQTKNIPQQQHQSQQQSPQNQSKISDNSSVGDKIINQQQNEILEEKEENADNKDNQLRIDDQDNNNEKVIQKEKIEGKKHKNLSEFLQKKESIFEEEMCESSNNNLLLQKRQSSGIYYHIENEEKGILPETNLPEKVQEQEPKLEQQLQVQKKESVFEEEMVQSNQNNNENKKKESYYYTIENEQKVVPLKKELSRKFSSDKKEEKSEEQPKQQVLLKKESIFEEERLQEKDDKKWQQKEEDVYYHFEEKKDENQEEKHENQDEEDEFFDTKEEFDHHHNFNQNSHFQQQQQQQSLEQKNRNLLLENNCKLLHLLQEIKVKPVKFKIPKNIEIYEQQQQEKRGSQVSDNLSSNESINSQKNNNENNNKNDQFKSKSKISFQTLKIMRIELSEVLNEFFGDEKFIWEYNQKEYDNFFVFIYQEIQQAVNVNVSQFSPFYKNNQFNNSNHDKSEVNSFVNFIYQEQKNNEEFQQREFSRVFKFQQPLESNVLNIKKCECELKQNYYFLDSDTLFIEVIVKLSGFPSAGNFQQKLYYFMENFSDAFTEKSVIIQYAYQTEFKEGLMAMPFKDKIKKNAQLENEKAWGIFKNQIINQTMDYVKRQKEKQKVAQFYKDN